MKRNKLVFAFISIIANLIFIISCEKRDFKPVAKVETKAITKVTSTTAEASGDIIDLGNGIKDYGHCWGPSEKPTLTDINDSKSFFGALVKTGVFTSELQNLKPAKLYHIRAYIKSGNEVLYGDDELFTTLGPPILTTTVANTITSSSAVIGGNVTSDGGSAITDHGVYWRASINPDTTGTKQQIGDGIGSFSTTLSGLIPNTIYYFKAYATNSVSTTYGTRLSFTTILGAPTNVSATAGNAQATVTFTAPGSNSGSAITGYTVTSNPGGFTVTGLASPIIVTGLTNGIAYTFTVIATNANGNSLPISPSNSVTPSVPSTVPGTPTIGTATAGNAQATVTFTAPASNGGSAITGYTVTSNPGGFKVTGVANPIIVTGLTNGTAYTFTVIATNAIGNSLASSASNSVTPSVPSTVPGAPTIGTATKGNGQATVTFTAPASNGGSTITGYTVTSSPGNFTGTGSASPITVTGLANGTAYTFTVIATNANGNSLASSASNSVTPSVPSTVPGAPTIGTATKGNAQSTITFTAPASNGGSSITGYTVTSNPGGFTGTGPASPITVTGLTNGTAYTFTVVATNAIGNSLASSASNSVTPSTVPGAPTIGTATNGNGQATVTFTAPASNGGSAITGYTVTSNPDGFTGTGSSSPIIITGLTNGTVYTFTVFATNANGNSSPSSPSNSVTPSIQIGEHYQGGVVAYILQPGDPGYIVDEIHGLIAAPGDQGSTRWGCYGTDIPGADGTAIGTGNQNTIDIMAGCLDVTAAGNLCGTLVLAGYSDWYLPSYDELEKLYENRIAIGGFAIGPYWSSSESIPEAALHVDFDYVQQYPIYKNSLCNVRAVRSF